MDENKFLLSLWLGVAFSVVLLVYVCGHHYVEVRKNYLEAGYEQVMTIGNPTPIWQKANGLHP